VTGGTAVWMDGALVPWDAATLHVLSHGLNNASAVFEGMRVYGGRIYALREHAERLVRSAGILRLALEHDAAAVAAASEAVVAAQGLTAGYVRPVVWLGEESIGISARGARTHLAIAAFACGDVVPASVRAGGARLAVSRWARPAPHMAPLQAKASAHYAAARLALEEARDAGFDDALLLDHRERVAEATGANFFVVKNGAVVTPPAESALDGITRRAILALAARRGLRALTQHLRLADLDGASEAFLTGTAIEVLAVSQVGEMRFGAPGPITAALAADYAHHVASAGGAGSGGSGGSGGSAGSAGSETPAPSAPPR
jgi:branched-chain amino acid aminotransferase